MATTNSEKFKKEFIESKNETKNAPRSFLCHSDKDKVFAENLARKLKSDGLFVWYDNWEMHVGDSIVQKKRGDIFFGLFAGGFGVKACQFRVDQSRAERYEDFSKNPETAYQKLVDAVSYHSKKAKESKTESADTGAMQKNKIDLLISEKSQL